MCDGTAEAIERPAWNAVDGERNSTFMDTAYRYVTSPIRLCVSARGAGLRCLCAHFGNWIFVVGIIFIDKHLAIL